MAVRGKKSKRIARKQVRRRSHKQSGGGNGFSVAVEQGSIAGMPVYSGYDSRQAPLYVGGITNEVNAMPMLPNPETGGLPPVTQGYDYRVMSSENSGELTGASFKELGRGQSGGGRKVSKMDAEIRKLIAKFRGIAKKY